MSLFSYQCHAIFSTITLQYNLKYEIVIPPYLLFRITLAILGISCFHMKFRIIFFQFLWSIALEFWWGLCWISSFWLAIFRIRDHTNLWMGRSFRILISSSISFFSVLKFLSHKFFTSLARFSQRCFWDYYEWYCFSDFFSSMFFFCI